MTNATIPLSQRQAPPAEALRIRRPVESGWMSGFVDCACQLAAATNRRAAHHIVTWPEGEYELDTDNASRTYIDDPVRVLWRASDLAEHAVVVCTYQCSESTATVAVALYDTTGVAQDAGWSWRVQDGTLQVSGDIDPGGELEYPIAFSSSGSQTHTATGAGVAPRPLIIPAAARGGMVEARLTPTKCRILSVSVWELYTLQVEA